MKNKFKQYNYNKLEVKNGDIHRGIRNNNGQVMTDNTTLNTLAHNLTRHLTLEENHSVAETEVFNTTLDHNWQATKTTIKERIACLFNNEKLADIYFKVGKGDLEQRIPAHKFVLSVGSSVFYAMFNGILATESDEIELPDVEPAAFQALLRFLYSDIARIGPETVMTTLYTAKKYAVPALEKHCVEYLQTHLASDNAFMLLAQARLFDEPKLATMCLQKIDKNTSDAVAAEGFIDVDLETLCCVLSRDSLCIKEAKLFQAVLRWSESECLRKNLPVTPENQRLVLGHALKLIRFPLMTIDEFAAGPAQSGVLMDKECVSLFLYFVVNPKPSIEFIDIPRRIACGNELLVNRFEEVEMRWGYNGISDRIRFVVDHPILVIGLGLFGSIYVPAEYKAYIEIIQMSTNKVIASNDSTFCCDGSTSKFKVMFEEPVQILPNTSYTASATLKGPDSHYGTRGLRRVSVDTPIGKVNFHFSYSSGMNNGSTVEDGQIPQILFYT